MKRVLDFDKWINEARREKLSGNVWAPIKELASAAADYLGIELKGASIEIFGDTYFSVYAENGRFLFTVEGGSDDEEHFTVHPDNSASAKVKNPLYWPERGKNASKKFDF